MRTRWVDREWSSGRRTVNVAMRDTNIRKGCKRLWRYARLYSTNDLESVISDVEKDGWEYVQTWEHEFATRGNPSYTSEFVKYEPVGTDEEQETD